MARVGVRTHSGVAGNLSVRGGCHTYSVHMCYPVAKELHPRIPKTAASLVRGQSVVFPRAGCGLACCRGSVSLTTLKAYLMRRVEEATISP